MSEPGSHQTSEGLAHRLRRMLGRDPHEPHRVATPLELLFDLTFVIAFGVAASQLAHMLASGHVGAGLAGFAFATFCGVLGVDQLQLVCLGLRHRRLGVPADDDAADGRRAGARAGIPQVFSSIAEGRHVDNRAMVAGYVVMRVAMVIQWLRAATQDPGLARPRA